MAKNTICVWYDKDAEAAARFYAKTFPDSAVGAIHRAPGDYPSGKKGDVLVVEFKVAGVSALLERHCRQRRPGERVRLVQRQVGRVVANHAACADRSDGGRRR